MACCAPPGAATAVRRHRGPWAVAVSFPTAGPFRPAALILGSTALVVGALLVTGASLGALLRHSGGAVRKAGSGVSVEMTHGAVYEVEGGRVSRIQLFLEPAHALAAAGVSE